MAHLKNVKKNVRSLVEVYPHLVNRNYNELIRYYWIIFDGVTNIDYLARATPAESITRNFRELVREGVIELSEESKKARKQTEYEYYKEFF